jgi:hypothetical protein
MNCFMFTQKPAYDVYSSFIFNCQNLEVTKISLSRWIDTLWYIQTVEHLVLEINELLSHEKMKKLNAYY